MNIIVTGASRGIGFEIVKKFSTLGNFNIIAIARNESDLNELKKVSYALNHRTNIYPLVFDLDTSASYEEFLLPRIKANFENVDILINNAGFLINKPFIKYNDNEVNKVININLLAPIKLIRAVLPIINQNGHVLNISSMGGFQGSQKFPGLSIYSTAKAGLACLTECLAEELQDSGIKFNCLAIGATDTEMLREAFPGYNPPFKALDMADFIVDFALNKSKFFNGKILPVTISTP